jgi:hypothetical protein
MRKEQIKNIAKRSTTKAAIFPARADPPPLHQKAATKQLFRV